MCFPSCLCLVTQDLLFQYASVLCVYGYLCGHPKRVKCDDHLYSAIATDLAYPSHLLEAHHMSSISSQIAVIFWLWNWSLVLHQAVNHVAAFRRLPLSSPRLLGKAGWQADKKISDGKNSCGGGHSFGATPRVERIRLWFNMSVFPYRHPNREVIPRFYF